MKKIVSIIVPVYNVEKFIFKTVNSILNQDYKNIEIILVDDGSPDNSARIIDELAKKDNRIVCVHKENGGVSSARNAGLKIATGEYVTFIDGDDWVEPNYVSYLLNLVEKNKCEIGMNKNNYSDDNMNSSDREYVVSDEKAIPFPIKRLCWRSSPHGRGLRTLSISRTMALVVLALTVPDF